MDGFRDDHESLLRVRLGSTDGDRDEGFQHMTMDDPTPISPPWRAALIRKGLLALLLTASVVAILAAAGVGPWDGSKNNDRCGVVHVCKVWPLSPLYTLPFVVGTIL